MGHKKVSIDLLSYFLKFIFFIATIFLLIFAFINISNFLKFAFDDFETRLCIYKSILDKNNLVSDFLINHNYDAFGAQSFTFLSESTSILNITIFLKIFECFKYLYYGLISFLSFKLLNRYSKNKIHSRKSNRYLLIIAILFILIPFIYLARDYIGCKLINNLGINKPHIYFEQFKFTFFIIGILIFESYLHNYLTYYNKSLKPYRLFSIISNSILILISSYYLISNIGNLFFTISNESSNFIYNKLLSSKHEFISILCSNSFEIFGYKYTYLGYYTNLITPIILHYLFNTIIYILLISYFVIKSYKILKNKKMFNENLLLFVTIILMFIFNTIVMYSVIIEYRSIEYYNKNLDFKIINFEYLYYFIPILFIYLLSINNPLNDKFSKHKHKHKHKHKKGNLKRYSKSRQCLKKDTVYFFVILNLKEG